MEGVLGEGRADSLLIRRQGLRSNWTFMYKQDVLVRVQAVKKSKTTNQKQEFSIAILSWTYMDESSENYFSRHTDSWLLTNDVGWEPYDNACFFLNRISFCIWPTNQITTKNNKSVDQMNISGIDCCCCLLPRCLTSSQVRTLDVTAEQANAPWVPSPSDRCPGLNILLSPFLIF